MGIEIERKFLVNTNMWKPASEGTLYVQGYICASAECVVRVRIAGQKAILGIKGLISNNTRREFEYEIPMGDAREMLDNQCGKPLVEKLRHRETHCGKLWEIDVFLAENEGLVVAEVELESESENIALPEFVAEEVSADPRYFNFALHKNPYRNWK
jgi:adenylate cyclase